MQGGPEVEVTSTFQLDIPYCVSLSFITNLHDAAHGEIPDQSVTITLME